MMHLLENVNDNNIFIFNLYQYEVFEQRQDLPKSLLVSERAKTQINGSVRLMLLL